VKRKYFGVIHCIAMCYDCDERFESMATGRIEAYRHAKKTGHSVNVEIGTSYTYNPKGD
jgi:ribosomal protein L34E